MMKPSISLCMIVKDEEKVIGRCLDTVKHLVDEIIIVDTGSTDQTLSIVSQYGAKTYSYIWNGNFAEARNYSLEKATADYILVLDADEYFPEGSNLQRDLKSNQDFYMFQIKNILENERYFIHNAIRLFKNTSKLRYKNRLHEHLDIGEIESELTWAEATSVIQHSGYDKNTMEEKDKNNRNLPIMIAEAEENPTSYNLYNLAKTYMNFEDYQKSIYYFKKAFPGSENKMYQPELLRKLVECLMQLEEFEEALDIIHQAVQIYPDNVDLLYVLGKAYEAAGYYKDAELAWIECTEIEHKGYFFSDGVTTYLPYTHLAELYEKQGNLAEAYHYVLKAALTKKNYAPILKKYLDIAYLTNLSKDSIKKDLDIVYRPNTVEDLQIFMDTLYTIRSPLLAEYLEQYNIKSEKHVQAVAYQFSKQYISAIDCWREMDQVQEDNTSDVLLISLLKQDQGLFKKLKGNGSLSDKEYKLLFNLLINQPIVIKKTSNHLEDILFDVFDKLIFIGEIEEFQKILNLLLEQKYNFKVRLAKLLIAHGYNEAAIDILSLLYNEKVNDIEVIEMLGDICLRAGYLEDAQLLYNSLLSLNNKYTSYERMYNLLEKSQNDEQLNKLIQEINDKFAYVRWVNENITSLQGTEFLPSNSSKIIRKTSIIILTHNKLDYTKLCIDSIQKYTPKDSYEIIVVDNASTDGTIEWLKSQRNLITILNKRNLGFPKGCNQGIEISTGDNILLLNNDVIVTPYWLENLLTGLYSADDIGIVGPITNNSSYYQSIAVEYQTVEEMIEFSKTINKSDSSCWERRIKLVGFCMLIKKEVINKIGMLDEIFTPGNYEDDDYSYRAVQAGYKLLLCRDTFIHHFGSVSFKEKSETYGQLLEQNRAKFRKKWGFDTNYSSYIRYDVIKLMDDHDKTAPLKILEVGCACGTTLLEIKNKYKNADLYGIELNKSSAAIASTFVNMKAENIEEEMSYEKNFFDYIILPDVLEHLIDPWKTLENLKLYLKDGGKVLASIPNVMHHSVLRNLINGRWQYEDAGLLDRTHYRFFTLTEINTMFMNANYTSLKYDANVLQTTKEDDQWIEQLAGVSDLDIKDQYKVYQYLIKATKDEIYSELKQIIIDVENNSKRIVQLLKEEKITVEKIIEAVNMSTVDKQKLYNELASCFYNNELYEEILPLLQESLKIDSTDRDTLCNIAIVLYRFDEKKLALDYLYKVDNKDEEILNLIEAMEE